MKAEDFTFEQLDKIQRCWWADAAHRKDFIAIYEVAKQLNQGDGTVNLENGVIITMQSTASLVCAEIRGNLTVTNDRGYIVFDNTAKLFIPGTWMDVIRSAYQVLQEKAAQEKARRIETNTQALRDRLLLHDPEYRALAKIQLDKIHGLQG